MPDATAAPAPPELPPVVNFEFHGFKVVPRNVGSQTKFSANSGILVLPSIIKSPFLQRDTNSLSGLADAFEKNFEENVVGMS